MSEPSLTPLQEAALHGVRRVINEQPSDDLLAESTTKAILDALPIKGWWIETDGYGDVTVWAPNPDRPDWPTPVAAEHSVTPEHWALLAVLIPAKDTQRRDLLSCTWAGCFRAYDPTDGDADALFCSEKCRSDEAADAEDHIELAQGGTS